MAGPNGFSLPRHPAVWWSRIKLRWPLLIWLAAAAAAVLLYRQGAGVATLRGMVETVYEEAAPVETARLAACYVEVGRRVEAGEALVRFDTTLIDAEIITKRLEIEERFHSAAARIEADLRDAERRRREDSAELRSLAEELERMEELVRDRLLDSRDVARYRTRHRALAETVAGHEGEIEELKEELSRLRTRRDETAAGWLGTGGGGSETDENNALGRLILRREQYTLRAENPGMVARLHAQPGTVIRAGTPTVTLVVDRPARIIGFAPEWFPRPIEPGQTLHVERAADGRTVRGVVRAVSPEMSTVTMEARIGLGAGRTIRGRRIVVIPEDEDGFLPGETVNLHLSRPWWRSLRLRRRGGE